MMASLVLDLRFAVRMFVKNPFFTAMVVFTLAVGIGLNTAVFSAIDAMLLRPLPGVSAPREIVQLYRTYPGGMQFGSNSIPHFNDLRDRTSDVFSGVALWTFANLSIKPGERPQRIFGQMVSANYFSLLGARAAMGRTFLPEEDVGRGAHAVAVLSDAGWHALFGADPHVVGRTVPVNGQNVQIVGVTAPGFRGALPLVDPVLWMPLMQLAQVRPGQEGLFERRGSNSFSVIARLAPGVSAERARARLGSLIEQLKTEHPDEYKGGGINLVPQSDAGIHPMFRSAQVGLSAVVMTVVAILLLIACVNVANLFLARARDRSREMAIRLSLGAQRSALLRQLLVESLLFAVVSGIAGLLIAQWAITLANQISLPIDADFKADLRLSPLVLLFTLGVTVVTALIFGVAPAWQATRPDLIPSLKGEAPAGQSRSRMRGGLVVAQMALSIVLLVCAGLFLVNLKSATTIDKGFVSEHRLTASFDPALQGYTRAQTDQFYRRLVERLKANPAVIAVGFIDQLPLSLNESDRGVTIPGYVPAANEDMSVQTADVAPGYFEAMGIPLSAGRAFAERDDSSAVPAVVINQKFADRFWRGQDAVGKTVHTAGADRTVLGVVPTGKYLRLGEDPTAFIYLAHNQHWTAGQALVTHVTGDPAAFIPTLRAEVRALDANMPLGDVRTLDDHLGTALLPARLVGAVLGIFGLLGLLLASVGVYGVMAYSVSQRTREIGIRMAIGAAQRDVVRLIMRQGLTLVLIGVAIGLVGAVGASRLLRSILYGGPMIDPLTFTLVPLLLVGVAALATWLPSRRAASLDPLIALRHE